MAEIYPTRSVTGAHGEEKEIAWEASDTLAAAGDGDSIIFPRGVIGGSVTASTDGAQVSVQATTSPLADVISGAGTVVWVTWPRGVVTVNTQDFIKPVTAIRLVQGNAGATRIDVVLQ